MSKGQKVMKGKGKGNDDNVAHHEDVKFTFDPDQIEAADKKKKTSAHKYASNSYEEEKKGDGALWVDPYSAESAKAGEYNTNGASSANDDMNMTEESAREATPGIDLNDLNTVMPANPN